MRGDWSRGEVEASPPCLCLRRDCEVTLPCLGQQQAAPAPRGRLSLPRTHGSQNTLLQVQSSPETLPRNTWRPPSPEATTIVSQATSCHYPPTSPSLPLQRPGHARRGSGERSHLPAICNPHPAVPWLLGCREWHSRVPLPGRRHVAALHARRPPPPRPVRHSQWRRGCSGQLETVRAAGAPVRAELGALQSERTARR